MSHPWRSYEEVARYLLDQFAAEFGLERVEGKQMVGGKRSGMVWEPAVRGLRACERPGELGRHRPWRLDGRDDRVAGVRPQPGPAARQELCRPEAGLHRPPAVHNHPGAGPR